MSKVYRQTISDELAAKVEAKRRALGLSIQEITIMALALLCQDERPVSLQPALEETQAVELLKW